MLGERNDELLRKMLVARQRMDNWKWKRLGIGSTTRDLVVDLMGNGSERVQQRDDLFARGATTVVSAETRESTGMATTCDILVGRSRHIVNAMSMAGESSRRIEHLDAAVDAATPRAQEAVVHQKRVLTHEIDSLRPKATVLKSAHKSRIGRRNELVLSPPRRWLRLVNVVDWWFFAITTTTTATTSEVDRGFFWNKVAAAHCLLLRSADDNTMINTAMKQPT